MTLKRIFYWICVTLATIVCCAAWAYVSMFGASIVSVLALYVVTIGVITAWMQLA